MPKGSAPFFNILCRITLDVLINYTAQQVATQIGSID